MIFNLIKKAKHLIYKRGKMDVDNVQDAIDGVSVDVTGVRTHLGLSKNILNHPVVATEERSGVRITPNDDKSITLNGTSTAEINIRLMGDYNYPMLDTSKEYIISGTPEGGSMNTYCLQVRRKFSNGSIYPVLISPEGYKTEIETEFNAGIVLLEIHVAAGVTLNNVTFYPMIREVSELNGNYEPYRVVDRIARIESLLNYQKENLSSHPTSAGNVLSVPSGEIVDMDLDFTIPAGKSAMFTIAANNRGATTDIVLGVGVNGKAGMSLYCTHSDVGKSANVATTFVYNNTSKNDVTFNPRIQSELDTAVSSCYCYYVIL